MIRIALISLIHDRAKLLAALAGVAFAAALTLLQFGLYLGFLDTSSSLIRHIGGDLWVMAKGTEVLDNGEPLSTGASSRVMAHPCVQNARPVVLSFATLRKPSGARDTVMLVGAVSRNDQVVPWSMSSGIPSDLNAPMRVSVDNGDLKKLAITGTAVGQRLEIAEREVVVAAVTEGIRSFTLSPYIFSSPQTARRILGLSDNQATYWAVDLKQPECAQSVTTFIERHPDLRVVQTAKWATMTEDFWVGGSGAGMAIGFSALLGWVVGAVIVGQTLYSLTRDHRRELATLKAIGAQPVELLGFVGYQASFLAVVGGSIGLLLAFGAQRIAEPAGLRVVLSTPTLLLGLGSVVVMCAIASISSAKTVLSLDAAEVFK